MTDERPSGERISDEEAVLMRQSRFGVLPQRITPADRVELTEVDSRRDLPDPEPWVVPGG